MIEAFRLALAQAVLLGAASVTPLTGDGPLLTEATMVVVGLATGLLWSGGAFDEGRTPWASLVAVAMLASVPGMLLWMDLAHLTSPDQIALLLLLPAATAVASAVARTRWIPRVAIDEDPAAAWARHNRGSYREGRATGRIPDTLSFNPYGPVTNPNRELPDGDPWDNAPLDHQQHIKEPEG